VKYHPHESDEDVDYSTVGLGEYTQQSLKYLDRMHEDRSLQAAYSAARYGIAGREVLDGVDVQIENDYFQQTRLDIDRDGLPDIRHAKAMTYISSVCAVSRDLAVSLPITVFPLPNYTRRLQTFWYEATVPGQQDRKPLQDVPNFQLGLFGSTGHIYVAFPALTGLPTTELDEYHQRAVHEEILYPSLLQLSCATYLRPSYETSMALARVRRPHDVVIRAISTFAAALRSAARISAIPGLRKPRFILEWEHPPFTGWTSGPPSKERGDAIDAIRRIFVSDNGDNVHVSVELSTDITAEGLCLRLKTDAHANILRWVSPITLTNESAQTIVDRHSNFRSHVSYQVPQLATFSFSPLSQDRIDYGIILVATSNLDTESTYTHVPWTPRLAVASLPQNITRLSDDLAMFCNRLNPDDGADDRRAREDGGVRISIRLPLSSADKVMNTSPLDLVRDWVAGYESRAWRCVSQTSDAARPLLIRNTRWFVWTRVRMIMIVIDMLVQARPDERKKKESIQLSIVVMVMLAQILSDQATFTTPLQEISGRATVSAEPSRSGQPELPPVPVAGSHGLYFVSDLLLHTAPPRSPYLPASSCLPIKDLLPYFQMTNIAELHTALQFRPTATSYIHRRVDVYAPRTYARTEEVAGILSNLAKEADEFNDDEVIDYDEQATVRALLEL
jgi:hypothetical protein